MELELDNKKKACFLVGYLAHQKLLTGIDKDSEHYKNNFLAENKFTVETLKKIYVWIVKDVSEKYTGSEFEDMIILASDLLIENDDRMDDVDVGYYYTLGFTSKEIRIREDNLYYE